MDRKTGRKYLRSGELPSEQKPKAREYRTRADPFEDDWPIIVGMLKDAPALEGKILFEWLLERYPERYQPGQLRTFQRGLKKWRATEGPPKEVFFSQKHRPGEAMQGDGTWAKSLEVTIAGERFDHLLYHVVLPYSNWEWATVCLSESLMAMRRGIQGALFRLGKVPRYFQTDNLSAATHELSEGGRAFNEQYREFIEHFRMEPRKIAVGESNQNGDVEASNGALKRNLKQHLLLRGSRDFESVETYERWVQEVIEKTNQLRSKKVSEELAAMKELNVSRLREHKEERVRVNSQSTIRIMNNTYSVPSQLIGEHVNVHIYDDRLEILHGGRKHLVLDRLLGRFKHRVDYHHIIWSLVKKPGAFARYRYREELFPGLVFRRAYDALTDELGHGYQADLEYLRILHRAASQSETDVELALELLLSEGTVPLADRVAEIVTPRTPEIPEMPPLEADLKEYDELLDASGMEVSS